MKSFQTSKQKATTNISYFAYNYYTKQCVIDNWYGLNLKMLYRYRGEMSLPANVSKIAVGLTLNKSLYKSLVYKSLIQEIFTEWLPRVKPYESPRRSKTELALPAADYILRKKVRCEQPITQYT